MKISSCSLQLSLEYDLDCIIESRPLTAAQHFAINALRSKFLSKRIRSNRAADEAAITEFLQQDNRPEYISPIRHLLDAELKVIIADMLQFADFGLANICQQVDVGPGSARGVHTTNSFLGKFGGDVTYVNPDLLRLFKASCECDSRWSKLYQEIDASGRFLRVKGGKMSPVPKTEDISRLVVTPPLLEILYDKAVGIELESCLRSVGIDLATQPDINRALAKRGSLCGDLCTIDLKGASNHLRYSVFDPLLPEGLRFWLRLTRPPVVEITGHGYHDLKMIQTMGSGVTFPLQSILFLAITTLAYKMCGVPLRTRGTSRNVAVFGDDLIVHKRCFDTVVALLKHYDLVVNTDKTFASGPFRESCGADWYDGVNVRPVYLKQTRSREDLFSVINRLTEWSNRLNLPSLVTVIGDLMRWRISANYLVPQHAEEYSGIRVPSCLSPSGRTSGRYIASMTRPTKYKYHGTFLSNVPTALWLSLLRGELAPLPKSTDTITVTKRVDNPVYIRRQRYTPNWDACPFSSWERGKLNNLAGFGREWDVNPITEAWISLGGLLESIGSHRLTRAVPMTT